MPRNRTPRQWREILDAFDRSDLSQAEFCRRRRIALATFRYHCARTRAAAIPVSPESPRFVEIFAEPSTHSGGELRIEIDLPVGPVTIHGQPAPLAELIQVLSSVHANIRI